MCARCRNAAQNHSEWNYRTTGLSSCCAMQLNNVWVLSLNKADRDPALQLIPELLQGAQLWFAHCVASKTDWLDCETEQGHWFGDMGIRHRQRRMSLPGFLWHGSAFGLWAYTHTHTHTSLALPSLPFPLTHTLSVERNTRSQKSLDTHTHTTGNIDFLFGTAKPWGTQLRGLAYSLDIAHKQTCCVLCVPPLCYTHPSRHCIDKHSDPARRPFTVSSPHLRACDLPTSSVFSSLPLHLSPPSVCVVPSVFIKQNGFFLASHSGVHCLAGLVQCWTLRQANTFYQPHTSTFPG